MSVPARVLAATVVALFAGLSSAGAETRLFNVKTDSPGLTVVGVARNGQALPVAGQNGDTTFFRIDNPAGAVPCANTLQFTLSDGQVTDRSVDLCAANWSLTVALAAAPQPPDQPSPAAVTSTTMAVATDDPSVTIQSVYLHGKEMPIMARQDPYVQVGLDNDPQGFDCARDLGLVLSDGRRIAREVDVCKANFVVVVPLLGGDGPGAPPASIAPKPEAVQAPVAPLPPPATPEVPTVDETQPPAMIDSMQWIFDQTAETATLAYAVPNSDEAEFTAVCVPQSRRATVTLGRRAGVGTGGTVPVRITAGTFDKTFQATIGEVSPVDGAAHPEMQVAAGDPLWSALIRERAVTLQVGSDAPYSLSLSGSSAKAKSFLAACNTPAQPVTQGPPVLQPQGARPPGGLACSDGSTISIAVNGASAVVTEPGRPPIVLFQTRSFVGDRYVSGLSEMIAQGPTIYWTREGQPQRVCSP